MKTIWEIASHDHNTPANCHGCKGGLSASYHPFVIRKKLELEGERLAFCDLECFLKNNGVWLVESGHSYENWQSVNAVYSSEKAALEHAEDMAKNLRYEKQPKMPEAACWKENGGKGPKWISVNQKEVDDE